MGLGGAVDENGGGFRQVLAACPLILLSNICKCYGSAHPNDSNTHMC